LNPDLLADAGAETFANWSARHTLSVTSAEVHLPAARGRLPGRRPQPASGRHTQERCLPEGTTRRDGNAVTRDSSCQVLTPITATVLMGQFGTPPTAQRQMPVAAA
jgi:hypothetical protein